MNKKRKALVIASAIVLSVALLGTGVYVGVAAKNGKLTGTIEGKKDVLDIDVKIGSDKINLQTDTSLKVAWKYILNATDSSTQDYYKEFNPYMAKFCLLMALDAQPISHVSLKGKTIEDNDNTSFPLSIGFEDSKQISVGTDATTDTNDTTTFVISSLKYKGGCTENSYFINVSFFGTDENFGEWSSNLDLGLDSKYKNSPDWVYREDQKGCSVAAVRALRAIFDYTSKLKNIDESMVTYCFNGYSRGGAMANLVARHLQEERIKNYTTLACAGVSYAFASQFTTLKAPLTDSSSTEEYGIYNIVSEDDVITNLPPKSLGFRRYGQDIAFSISGEGNEALREQYKKLAGIEFSNTYVNKFNQATSTICTSREDYYDPNLNDDSIVIKQQFATVEEANEYIQTLSQKYAKLCPLNGENYYKISEPIYDEEKQTYTVKAAAAPSFVGQFLIYALTGKINQMTDYYKELFNRERYKNFYYTLLNIFMNDTTFLKYMHLPMTYLVYLNSLIPANPSI